MKLYLAHPFDTRTEVRALELEFERQTGIELLNPFYDTGREDTLRIDLGRESRYSNLRHRDIVLADLQHIRECSGVLACLYGNTFQFGTPCECWFAMSFNLPVYFISVDHCEHPWVKFIAEESFGGRFYSWLQFKQYIMREVSTKDE